MSGATNVHKFIVLSSVEYFLALAIISMFWLEANGLQINCDLLFSELNGNQFSLLSLPRFNSLARFWFQTNLLSNVIINTTVLCAKYYCCSFILDRISTRQVGVMRTENAIMALTAEAT